MKRKGADAISSGLSVVVNLPFEESKSTDVNTPSSLSSPFSSMLSQYSPTSSRTWEETQDAVDKILQLFQGPKACNDITMIKENREIIKKLEGNVDVLKSKSDTIKVQIQSKIDACINEMENEEESIRFQRGRLETVEKEVSDIKKNTLDLLKLEKELKIKIEKYRVLASEEVEQLDEVEEEKKAEVYRLQKHISLLALVSGIQWDYECVDSVAGEVEIPSSGKHVRFEIDRDNHTPFEIANMLWDTIAAK